MFSLLDLSQVCTDATGTLFGILDPSIAPSFMYYSYVPIIFISLSFALFISYATKGTLTSRLLLWAAVLFSLELCGEILLWISTPVRLIQFVWQDLAVLQVFIVALIGYFTYTFITGRDLPTLWKWIWAIPIGAILVLTPTHLNVSTFDFLNCESNQGPLWLYIYVLEGIIALGILWFAIAYARKENDKTKKRRDLIAGIGTFICLAIYIAGYAIGDVTLVYNVNLIGPLGMVALLATIAYLIVVFHAFNLRVLSAQALVATLIALIFSALFVRTVANMRYVLVATLAFVIVLGAMLIRGVLREVRQRERIEQLAADLEVANEAQVTLIHFITHQIKGFVTKSRNIFSMALEGDFGPLPERMKPMIEEGFRSDTQGVNTIQEILNASNIKTGKVTYDMQPFDLKALVDEIAGSLKANADSKGLTLNLDTGNAPLTITGDRGQLVNAFKNLIDNSIKYTQQGHVDVSLKKDAGKAIFKIEDSGVGISAEDMKNLFTEGGHGKESTKVNVESTGFGLYIVKNIIEAHHGKVWAESEGAGKGSRFFVELPA